MIVVLPFYYGDIALFEKNLRWYQELDGKLAYDAILVSDNQTNDKAVIPLAKEIFKSVKTFKYPRPANPKWPIPQNNAFAMTAWAMRKYERPWIWVETDAVPLKPKWLDTLWAEYQKGGKPFGGHWSVPNRVFNGVAIYPWNVPRLSPRCIKASMYSGEQSPWDAFASKEILPQAHCMNNVMQHIWNFPNGTAPSFPDKETAKTYLREGIVLFHRCKDGSLIDLMRGVTRPVPAMPELPLPELAVGKFIHVTERHAETDPPARKLNTWKTWDAMKALGNYTQAFYWDKDYKRSHPDRNLPYLRDTLECGLSAADPSDIIMLTNDDTIFHPQALKAVAAHIKKMPYGCSFRKDIPAGSWREYMLKQPPLRLPLPNNTGHDLFFWQADFLKAYFDQIPDFVLGAWKWDLILSSIMRQWAGIRVDDDTVHANTTVELPFGYVLHEQHKAFWSRIDNVHTLGAQKHNNDIYLKWIKLNAKALLKTLP